MVQAGREDTSASVLDPWWVGHSPRSTLDLILLTSSVVRAQYSVRMLNMGRKASISGANHIRLIG